MNKRIFVYGDSFASSTYPNEEGVKNLRSWSSILEQHHQVSNRSVIGCGVEYQIRRLLDDIQEGQVSKNDVMIFVIPCLSRFNFTFLSKVQHQGQQNILKFYPEYLDFYEQFMSYYVSDQTIIERGANTLLTLIPLTQFFSKALIWPTSDEIIFAREDWQPPFTENTTYIDYKLLNISLNEGTWDKSKPDLRAAHLSDKNNQQMANMILRWIAKDQKPDISQFVCANNLTTL